MLSLSTGSGRLVSPVLALALAIAASLAFPTVASAQEALTVGQEVTGTIPADGNVTYTFTATDQGTYVFTTTGETDTVLQVTDAAGQSLGENDDYGGGTNSQVIVPLEAAQVVTVAVSGYDGAGGPFGLAVRAIAVEASARSDLAQGGMFTHQFTARQAGNHTVRAYGARGNDTFLRVRDASGDLLGENDDANDGLDSEVVVELLEGQTITIEVTDLRGAPGSVRVEVALGGELSPVRVGAPLPELPEGTTDAEGNPITVASFRGRVLLIDFWASWCGPCRAEMPNVIGVYRDFHDRGFDILGVSLDRSLSDMRVFLQRNAGMTWKQVCDEGYWQAACARAYQVRAIPFTILLDGEGRVVATNLRGEALRAEVSRLLSGGAEPGAGQGGGH